MDSSNDPADFLLSREYLLGLLAADDGRWRELATVIAEHPERHLLVQDLHRLSDTAPVNGVRYKAKKILAALSQMAAETASRPEGSVPRGGLVAGLRSADVEARLEVLKRYAAEHGPGGADELFSWMEIEKEPRVLAGAMALIQKIGTPAHLDRLQPFLRHGNDRVVAGAVEAMGHLDPQGAFHRVLPILLREDNRVRANVLMVLQRTDRFAVLANLQRMARHKEEAYRASALWCLAQLKDEDIQDILLKMMQSEDSPELLEKQAKLMLEVGTEKTLGGLLALGRSRPSRANLARKLIQQIATRLGLDLRRIELPAPGRDTMPRVPIPSMAIEIPEEMREWRRPALAVAGGLAGILTIFWMFPRGTPEPEEIPAHRPLAAVATESLPAGGPAEPSGPVKVRGQAIAQRGPVLVLDREGTLYGCRRTDGSPWPPDRLGKETLVEGRLRGWDRDHGFYRVDAAGGTP